MFTGIVKEKGKIIKIEKGKKVTTFTVETSSILKNKKIGESIALNGACMTITSIKGKTFTFDAMPETLEKTNLNMLKLNNEVNLEPSLTLNQALDGHFVQGHVDSTGKVEELETKADRTILKIKFHPIISKYLALKGSITINGVSLTISDLRSSTFSVDLIPHTLKITNLGKLKKGDIVNLEVDLIARYLKRLLDSKENQTKYEFLKERGFI